MTESQTTRVHGVEFGRFAHELAEVEFPVSSTQLVERCGECQLEHANGTTSVADVLGPMEETFRSARQVREAVVGSVGMGAVGRQRYTDRGGTAVAEEDKRPNHSL